MGKAPTWTTKEREVVALAWLRATNNGIQGADQKSEVFRNKIHALFKAFSPRDAPPGRFGDRPPKAVYVFLRDQVFPDINKFNESLRLVQASHPTGCNDDNILSMAIAVHLGEARRMDYQFRNFEHTSWPNFGAWKILRVSPKFRPPTSSSVLNEDALADATTVDPTAAAPRPLCANNNHGGHQVNNSFVPSMIFPAAETTDASTVLTEPTTTKTVEIPSTIDLYLESTEQTRKEIDENNVLGQQHITSSALGNLDPSNGGRGALMGNKKAKAEYKRQQIEMEKNKRLMAIEKNLKKQAKEQAEAHQVFKLRQLIKLAKSLQNKRLMEKAEKEIEQMLDSPADDNQETSNRAEADDESVDDSIPPSSFCI
jgi:hypothetical protein